MNYEEWLNTINEYKNTGLNKEKIKKLQEEPLNPNINEALIPKLEDLVKVRFQKIVKNIISDLQMIFSDVNYLDLSLVNFKKEINYILDLINLKQFPEDNRLDLLNMVKIETENVYSILIKEANRVDQVGMLGITINNNRIKWSDNNEL